jgi:hypothetical protein
VQDIVSRFGSSTGLEICLSFFRCNIVTRLLPHSSRLPQRHDEMHAENVVAQEVQWDHRNLVLEPSSS